MVHRHPEESVVTDDVVHLLLSAMGIKQYCVLRRLQESSGTGSFRAKLCKISWLQQESYQSQLTFIDYD
jgi:hypothetical protein